MGNDKPFMAGIPCPQKSKSRPGRQNTFVVCLAADDNSAILKGQNDTRRNQTHTGYDGRRQNEASNQKDTGNGRRRTDAENHRPSAARQQGARETGNGRLTANDVGRSAGANTRLATGSPVRSGAGQKEALEKLYTNGQVNVAPNSAKIIDEGGKHGLERN